MVPGTGRRAAEPLEIRDRRPVKPVARERGAVLGGLTMQTLELVTLASLGASLTIDASKMKRENILAIVEAAAKTKSQATVTLVNAAKLTSEARFDIASVGKAAVHFHLA